MVYKKFSEEDKIIINYLQQTFGYGAKRIIKDHPEKNWGLRNVGYLLKKIDETGDVKRWEVSGRPRTKEKCEHFLQYFLIFFYIFYIYITRGIFFTSRTQTFVCDLYCLRDSSRHLRK